MTTLTALLLGVIVGYALRHWRAQDDMLALMLDECTPIVRWWHRRFGHGKGYPCAGICWACGMVTE